MNFDNNEQQHEFSTSTESDKELEYNSPIETQSFKSDITAPEFDTVQNTTLHTEIKKTDSSFSKKLLNNFAPTIAASASIILMTVIMIVSGVFTNRSISLDSITVYGTSLDYSITALATYTESDNEAIDFSNYATGYSLLVYNNSFQKEIAFNTSSTETNCTYTTVQNGSSYDLTFVFNGKVEGLTEGTAYKIAIVGIENNTAKTFYEQSIMTKQKVSEVRAINGYCRCQVDGTYRFTIDFTDENKHFSNFRYQLTELDGTEITNVDTQTSGEIENPTQEQIIHFVDILPKNEYLLNIYYDSNDGISTSEKKISIQIYL